MSNGTGLESAHNPLGQTSEYKDTYDAGLLHPIPRDESWRSEGKQRPLIPWGRDIWNAWEMSWLNLKGKPLVAIGEIHVPADSPNLIESKSLKLYLNSWNQMRVASTESMLETIENDLSVVAGAQVRVYLALGFGAGSEEQCGSRAVGAARSASAPEAECIDELDVEIDCYQPDAELLKTSTGTEKAWLYSHLLKSNCPVTSQPDWGSLYLYYSGDRIDREALLKYIVSMRQHQGFHEQCVEQIYTDVMRQCQPEQLLVCARYVRRGGLDINPVRASGGHLIEEAALNFRILRQ